MSHPDAGPRAKLPVEGAAVAGAWLLLAGLRLLRSPLTFDGALGWPLPSVLAALAALWLAPGYVLWRWLVAGPRRHAAAWSVGLGLAWLMAPCAAAMTMGTTLPRLLDAVVALNGALAAAHLVLARRAPPLPARTKARFDPALAWMAGAALLVGARLLDVATRRVHRLTYGGDEWAYMAAVRRFLEGPTLADPAEFDVWDLVLALLVRLSGVEVLEAYRVHLPPVLLVAALLALLALGESVLRRPGAAALAVAIQGLFALSDMHTRGEGMGMALLVRLAEDKYAALLIALPLAQAAFLDLVRGRTRALATFVVLAAAATLLQPFAVPWLALSCGATYVLAAATGLVPRSPRLMAALALLLAAGAGLAWALRALRPASYFALHAPHWGFNQTLLELSYRQLWVLSLEKGWYLAHPALLEHPLMVAALGLSLLLLPRARRSVEAQWLLASTWVPVLLAFNPVTAVLIGRLVTPWRLYRLLWAVPVALVLAWALDAGARAAWARLESRRAWAARAGAGPLAVAVLLVMALALDGRTDESARALRARNRILVKPEERQFLHAVAGLAREAGLRGLTLAPEAIGIRLPVWTTRLRPIPDLPTIREGRTDVLEQAARFQQRDAIGGPEAELLQQAHVRYLITDLASPLERAVRAHPAAFRLLKRGEELALYEWRPEYWGRAAPTAPATPPAAAPSSTTRSDR